MKSQKIIIVTGISNVIGKEFMRYYSYTNNIVIGISRTLSCGYGFKNAIELQIDLLDQKMIETKLKKIFLNLPWHNIQECVLIHTSGKAKNDALGIHTIIDVNKDGIDDEVYEAQIVTFDNLHEFLVEYLIQKKIFETIKMTIVGFGSLIDDRLSPIHYSMRSVNNIMREKFKLLSKTYAHYRAIILSASTIATEKEIKYRKYADQTYWLTGAEVVDKSISYIEGGDGGYMDIPIFKYHPLYQQYFKDETVDQLVSRFRREVGLEK